MLEQVQDTLTVDAIMTGRKELVTLASSDDSSNVQEAVRELQINQVPIVERGAVVGILVVEDHEDRTLPDTEEFEPISPKWLVSADTSIRKLIDILDERQHPARFIFRENRVVGLVTYADLNKAIARTALYLLLSRLEIKLARVLRSHDKSAQDYIQHLKEKRQKELANLQDDMIEGDVAQDLIENLNLPDLFRVIRHEPDLLDELGFPEEDHFNGVKGGIRKLRNDVAHSVSLIIDDVEDGVRELNRRCRNVEDLLDRTPTYPPQRTP
jgi:hypothetical protein